MTGVLVALWVFGLFRLTVAVFVVFLFCWAGYLTVMLLWCFDALLYSRFSGSGLG